MLRHGTGTLGGCLTLPLRSKISSPGYRVSMRAWMFGRSDWVYPWMRWLSVPAFRIGVLLCGLSIAVSGYSSAVTWVGVGLMAASLLVELVNFLLLRGSRHSRQVTP